MTLTLTPDTEARVRSVAQQSGQDPEDALITLINQALAEAEAETEMLAALRAGEADHDAGRSMTIEEYRLKALARRREHDADSVRRPPRRPRCRPDRGGAPAPPAAVWV